jgi:hypothetical protein
VSAARPGGSFLKQIYDKLLLVVALVALLGSALFLIVRISEDRNALQRGTFEQDPQGLILAQPIDPSAYSQAVQRIVHPSQLPVQGRVLTSEQRVACVECGKPIPYNAATCPFCKVAQPEIKTSTTDSDGDNIPDEVETKLGLNPEDPSDAELDLDNDLFTNIEEFRSGTDINNPTNFPSPVSKLRLIKTTKVPFKLRFVAVSDVGEGDQRYQINLRTLERTYFAKMNEEVEGWIVAAFDPKGERGPTLALKQGDRVIQLAKGEVITLEDARSATVVLLLDGKMNRVQIGDAIQVKEQDYKVIDIADTHVLVRDEQTGRETTIGLLSEEEKDRLQSGLGGARQPAPSSPSPSGRIR